MLRKDAAPFWVRVEATTAQGADGASVCRAVVSDITESKRAERVAPDAPMPNFRNSLMRLRTTFRNLCAWW